MSKDRVKSKIMAGIDEHIRDGELTLKERAELLYELSDDLNEMAEGAAENAREQEASTEGE